MLGKEQELEIRKETKLGQKTQQIVCKRMIQAALIWICSLAKTQRRSSSLSVSGDDKRRRGRVTGRLQLQHLGNAAGPGAPGPLPPQLITAKRIVFSSALFIAPPGRREEEEGEKLHVGTFGEDHPRLVQQDNAWLADLLGKAGAALGSAGERGEEEHSEKHCELELSLQVLPEPRVAQT